jgi:uncharacterized protein (TIGR00297 family)
MLCASAEMDWVTGVRAQITPAAVAPPRVRRERPLMPAWLSPAGTLSALVVGGLVAAGTGWRGLVLLFVFLAGSSLLTPGGGRRRPIQVFANGGVAAVCAALAPLDPAWVVAFAGALATAAADTWATEIGGRSPHSPRLITSRAPVPRGWSGGVTLLGTLGGAGGAVVIAVAGWIVGLLSARTAAVAALAGIVGMFIDSLVGATVQARWRCGQCDSIREVPACECGGTLVPHAGIRWMTNDAVNFVATLSGAASATAFLSVAHLP